MRMSHRGKDGQAAGKHRLIPEEKIMGHLQLNLISLSGASCAQRIRQAEEDTVPGRHNEGPLLGKFRACLLLCKHGRPDSE